MRCSETDCLIGWHFIVQTDNDPKHTAKEIQEFIKAKKWNILELPGQFLDLRPIEHSFHLFKAKSQSERFKQTAAAVKAWQSIKKTNST